MEIGPTKRIVRRVLTECLSRFRLYGHLKENMFAEKVCDFPTLLRDFADQLVAPSEDLTCQEPPNFTGYSKWADNYDSYANNPVIAGEEAIIWDLIGDVRNKRVLDAGCGTGRHAIETAKMGAEVTAIDPTKEMLDIAKGKSEEQKLDIHFKMNTIENIDEDIGQFDLVLCCLVLSHIENLRNAISILAAHVDYGGSLIVSDFHPLNILVGFRTSFTVDNQKYVVPNFLHLPSDYYNAIQESGLTVTAFHERGKLERLPGLPMTIIMKADKSKDM